MLLFIDLPCANDGLLQGLANLVCSSLIAAHSTERQNKSCYLAVGENAIASEPIVR